MFNNILIAAGVILFITMIILAFKRLVKPLVSIIAVIAAAALIAGGVLLNKPKIPLKIELIGEKEITLQVFDEYKEQGAKAFYGEEDITESIVKKGEVDTKKLGDYTVTYEVKTEEETASAERKIHIADNTAPEIKLNGNKKVTVSALKFYKEKGAAATDNYDGDISSKIKTEQIKIDDETYEVVYSVEDSSGNSVNIKRMIVIKDVIAPKITLKGSQNLTLLKGGTYTEAGFTASDDLDGDLTSAVTVSGSVNTAETGSYIITYSVKDKAGNKASEKRTVNVTVPDKNSVICLTFDDGPSTKVTPRILDILKANDVKATFFIVNYNDSTLPLIKRMIAEGHTIGIHGYSHDWGIYDSEEKFMNNIYKLRDKLFNDTGYTSTVMRFPGGSSNMVSIKHCKGIMTKLVSRVQADGWKYYDWNVDSGDANGSTIPKNTLIKNFKSGVKKGRTNIVLCHDIGSKTTTADALQSYIDYGKQNGFTFKAIDENTPQCHHSLNN